MRRYSEMSALELESEMSRLLEAKKEAESLGRQNEAELLERKYFMAMAYTLSPTEYQPGAYSVTGQKATFELEYLNGVMAWGRVEGQIVSFPISMLTKL